MSSASYVYDLTVDFSFRHQHEIVPITPPRPAWAAIGEKLGIRGVCIEDDEIHTNQEFAFEFRGNPVVDSVHPQEAIAQ